MELLSTTIMGDPVAKGRPRVNKNGHAYTPQKTKDAEEALRQHVIPLLTHPRSTEPIGLAVTFYCATRRRTDGDNMLKLVTDAMNKIVYEDDSQIEEWWARVHRAVPGEEPRTEILIYTLEEEVPLPQDPALF